MNVFRDWFEDTYRSLYRSEICSKFRDLENHFDSCWHKALDEVRERLYEVDEDQLSKEEILEILDEVDTY